MNWSYFISKHRKGVKKLSLLVLIGAQAVGKMTIGKELEKHIDGRLLFNHQTIDLCANYLGYTEATFKLSNQIREELFTAFVNNLDKNPIKTMIFTVLIDFSQSEDIQFLHRISEIFLNKDEKVYFVELIANLEERILRNKHEDRLTEKPSKRDIESSHNELVETMKIARLETNKDELKQLFPKVNCLKIDNTFKAPQLVAKNIIDYFNLR